ncbi:helix-turn-helix transcriptional regulator [Cellulomonas palmilytica]|uniref:helix-turn-helix transcriptional regulator n=1 Tax=Cellulomonas palmilytica TaxID=2608402 RepID=UPI00294FEFCD|nr:helix-turn-helix transcriptional regulator [Cellulomonas palmilytica]UJP38620.1 AAA family ATPase [Cellulomonas palmilytica]
MSTPFVARQEQVVALADALHLAGSGMPGAVLLAGDAGVGKSALLRHVAATSTDATVVVTHCVELGEIGLPYLPFAEAVSRLREIAPDAVAATLEARPALGRLVHGTSSDTVGDGDQLQLFEGLSELFAAVARPERPLLLVVEDAHWADASSRDVLRFLVTRMTREPVLLVVSYRTDDLHRRHPWRPVAAELARHPRVTRLELAPFTPDELAQFASALTGHAVPEPRVRRIAERSGGNAYFAQELLEGGDDEALPWTLADVLRARVEQLDPAVQQLARVAAVAGRRVGEPLLRAAARASSPGLDVDATLREAVGQHVLGVEDGHLAFRHALLGEAIAGDLLPGERSALHHAYVRVLSEDPSLGTPAELAAHALAAPDLPVALRASLDAAAAAHELLAPQEELRHLEVALSLWDAVPDAGSRVGVLAAAADAAGNTARRDRAVQIARSAVEIADDDERPELRIRLARHLQAYDRAAAALAETALALEELPPTPSATRAWALATHGRSLVQLDRDVEAFDVVQEALTTARNVSAIDAESDALASLAMLVVSDDADRADAILAEALAAARSVGDAETELRILANMAAGRYDAGDLTGTAELTAAGLARAREMGMTDSGYGLELAGYAALTAYVRGDLSPVEVPARERVEDGGFIDLVVLYSSTARGDADVVERCVALDPLWRHIPDVALAAGGCAADALTWLGRYDEAVDRADRAIRLLSKAWLPEFFGGIWLSSLALAALADAAADARVRGQDTAALVAAGEPFAQRVETTAARPLPPGRRIGPEGLAWIARAHAEHARLQGSPPGTVELWRAAVDAFGYGHRYEQARSRWRLAEALVLAGERDEAAIEAQRALDEAEAMGAAPLARALHELARRARLPVGGVPEQGADVLTAREAEVLALVAQGLSNNQIGRQLFISGKTVSVHVSNVLAKLGASGRAEAVDVAHRRGLIGVR